VTWWQAFLDAIATARRNVQWRRQERTEGDFWQSLQKWERN
jgi:hypothetical protein